MALHRRQIARRRCRLHAARGLFAPVRPARREGAEGRGRAGSQARGPRPDAGRGDEPPVRPPGWWPSCRAPWTPAHSDSCNWSRACASVVGCCRPGTRTPGPPGQTSLGPSRVLPRGPVAGRPGAAAHFGAIGCQCHPPYPASSELGACRGARRPPCVCLGWALPPGRATAAHVFVGNQPGPGLGSHLQSQKLMKRTPFQVNLHHPIQVLFWSVFWSAVVRDPPGGQWGEIPA